MEKLCTNCGLYIDDFDTDCMMIRKKTKIILNLNIPCNQWVKYYTKKELNEPYLYGYYIPKNLIISIHDIIDKPLILKSWVISMLTWHDCKISYIIDLLFGVIYRKKLGHHHMKLTFYANKKSVSFSFYQIENEILQVPLFYLK